MGLESVVIENATRVKQKNNPGLTVVGKAGTFTLSYRLDAYEIKMQFEKLTARMKLIHLQISYYCFKNE